MRNLFGIISGWGSDMLDPLLRMGNGAGGLVGWWAGKLL